MSGATYHVEDVGRILLQVQSELASLKTSLKSGAADGVMSKAAIERIIAQAEADLKAKTEMVLNSLVAHEVKTLPVIPSALKASASASLPGTDATSLIPRSTVDTEVAHKRPRRPLVVSGVVEEHREKLAAQLRSNPTSNAAREMLARRFGIPHRSAEDRIEEEQHEKLAKAERRRENRSGRIKGAKTMVPRRLLPRQNRMDPSAPAPELGEEDMREGVLELLNRGFVAGSVDLGPVFTEGPSAPMRHSAAPVHEWSQQHAKATTQVNTVGFSLSSLKLDATKPPVIHSTAKARLTESSTLKKITLEGPATPVTKTSARQPPKAIEPVEIGEKMSAEKGELKAKVDKIRGYDELLDTYSLHQFIIRKGVVLASTPEFQSYKRTYKSQWGPIVSVIRGLEKLMLTFAVPIAYIDGQEVARIGKNELETPSTDDYLRCITNIDQVGPLLRVPGRRFLGSEGRWAAACKIQATWHMYQIRTLYRQHKLETAAASKIQGTYNCFRAFKRTRAELERRRKEGEDAWTVMQGEFRKNWGRIKGRKRVELHIPSISREEGQRTSLANYLLKQNAQIARLAALKDPNVDIVYIAPFEIHEDIKSYYNKLLEVGGVALPASRFRFIVPEKLDKFPEHYSLTSVLIYSPRAMRRLSQFLRGKDCCYIVPHVAGPEEKRLSMLLRVPLLASDPEIAQVLGTKSGAKRIFAMADVNVPPGAHDVYEAEDAIRSLAKLMAANLDVPRWLFKLDNEFGGRGHAYYDVSNLKCMDELRLERQKSSLKDPLYWSRVDVQEVAREKILSSLAASVERNATLAVPEVYGNWSRFMSEFCEVGGVIEATPTDIIGSSSVDVIIEPSGEIRVLCTHEQIHSKPYVCGGASFPAQSVPHDALYGASEAVCAVLVERGVIGHVCIDFVTFWDHANGAQRLWAVDLNLCYSSTAVSFGLFDFLMSGRYDKHSGNYYIHSPDKSIGFSKSSSPPMAGAALPASPGSPSSLSSARDDPSFPVMTSSTASLPARPALSKSSSSGMLPIEGAISEKRFYTVADYIYHPNLSSIRYNSFFNMCRLKGVSFDLHQRVGTAFILIDSLASGVLGLLSVGRSYRDSVASLHGGLSFIKDQVGVTAASTEFQDEESNFKPLLTAVKDLRSRLETTRLPLVFSHAR